MSVFRVPVERAGERLDRFLQSELKRTSRTRTQYIVKVSAFDVHGKRMKSNHRLAAEERILLWRPAWDENPVPTECPVVWEDDWFLAVNKPPFLPVHPTARYYRNTVIKVLQAERPGQFLSLAHRIDRETSGVLLLAKTAEADRKVKRLLEDRDDVGKSYLAIAKTAPEGFGTEPIRFECFMRLAPDARYKVKMSECKEGDVGSMHSSTVFRKLETRANGYTMMACVLETGRQHQIRLHLSMLGAPIVGDKLYGPDDGFFAKAADNELTEEDLVLLEHDRHALHAHTLEFNHPFKNERTRIVAPLPSDLALLWERANEVPKDA